MKAKFDSTCKVCNAEVKEGEDIYYDRDKKIACKDLDCYKKQGGSSIQFPSGGGAKYQRPTIDVRIAEVNAALKNALEQLKTVQTALQDPMPTGETLTFIESMVKSTVSIR